MLMIVTVYCEEIVIDSRERKRRDSGCENNLVFINNSVCLGSVCQEI